MRTDDEIARETLRELAIDTSVNDDTRLHAAMALREYDYPEPPPVEVEPDLVEQIAAKVAEKIGAKS